MENTIERLELLQAMGGRESDFAHAFVNDVYTQLDLIEDDAEELVELISVLSQDPIGSRFISLLVGVDTPQWIEDTIESLNSGEYDD